MQYRVLVYACNELKERLAQPIKEILNVNIIIILQLTMRTIVSSWSNIPKKKGNSL